MFALFETTLPRLKREHFGFKIEDKQGIKKDTGVQDFVDELLGALSDVKPIDMQTPLAMTNNTGGNAIIVNGGDDDSGIQVNNGDDSVTLGSGGLTFVNNQFGGSPVTWGPVTNVDGSITFGPTTNLNTSSIITNIYIEGDTHPHSPAVIAKFRLEGTLSKLASPANGVRIMCDESEEGDPVPVYGDFAPGVSESGDKVLAWWDKCEEKWYAFATNKQFYTGDLVAFITNNPTFTVNSDCTITVTGLVEYHVVDGLVKDYENL